MQSWQSKAVGKAVFSRGNAVRTCVSLFTALLCGCMSISITHTPNVTIYRGKLGGKYNIKKVESRLAAALRKNAPNSIVFTDNNALDAVCLDVCISGLSEGEESISMLSVVIGSLSFTALPVVREKYKTGSVLVVSPLGTNHVAVGLTGRKSWTGLTPLGFLPQAFPLEGYECTLGDCGEEWREEDNAWSSALQEAAAKAIITMLTKEYYAECIKRQRADRWQKHANAMQEKERKAAEEVRKKKRVAAQEREKLLRLVETGWPQEVKLREFAIKEIPEIWEMVVAQRAVIFNHRANLLKLRSSLIDFGKVPEEDAEYVKSRRQYDVERAELVRIFRCLEKAYLASCKNASLYEGAEALEKTKQAIEECIKEVGPIYSKSEI